jgi:plastocyanin
MTSTSWPLYSGWYPLITTQMSRPTLIAGILIFLVALLGALFLLREETYAPEPQPQGTGNATVGATGETLVITYTDSGFSPAEVTIAPGTTVTWSNESSGDLAVVDSTLNVDACPENSQGTALHQCESIGQGGSYSHTFTTSGTVTYANKEARGDTGTITVREETTSAGPINPDAIPN